VSAFSKAPAVAEAQICNLADEIAYNNHDVDDGLRSGVLTLEQLQEVSLVRPPRRRSRNEFPRIAGRRRVHETIRRMIDAQVTDLLPNPADNIAASHRQASTTCIARRP
jgi:dGTPase